MAASLGRAWACGMWTSPRARTVAVWSRRAATPLATTRRAQLPLPLRRTIVAPASLPATAGPHAVSPAIMDLARDLPIRECLGAVLHSLDTAPCLVLQAPPGAGKTTVVPLAMLLHSPAYLSGGRKVLVLEPRRVAAKAAARRMAAMLGERVGQTVGYRVRLDTCIGPATRIEVVTNGILVRMLQSDPELPGVGAVLLDELHERSLDADLALALLLDAQRTLNPKLRVAVASATLGGGLAQRCVEVMGGGGGGGSSSGSSGSSGSSSVPVVVAEGRSYPVSVERLLQRSGVKANVLPLHGSLPPDQQDEAIRPRGGPGRARRVILSTPIAESSITIDGVRVVVDSGLRRSPKYDTQTGVNRLALTQISEASAEQRAGRAGRTSPGVCYRLWERDAALLEATPPEIEEADLAPCVLDLALWGCTRGDGLPWLDAPDSGRVDSAVELLQELGALDSREGGEPAPTEEGRRMARFGVHPRFAHMVLSGDLLGVPELAAVVAALLSERDLLRGSPEGDSSANIMLRLRFVAAVASLGGGVGGGGGDRQGASRALQSASSILSQLRSASSSGDDGGGSGVGNGVSSRAESDSDDADDYDEASISLNSNSNSRRDGVARSGGGARGSGDLGAWGVQMEREGLVGALLASAYPDRIARRKGDPGGPNGTTTFQMAGGALARLPIRGDPLGATSEFLSIAELGGSGQRRQGGNDNIYVAAALSSAAIEAYLQAMVSERRVCVWGSASRKVVARMQKRLGALVLEERSVGVSDAEAVPALLRGFREMGGLANLGLPAALEGFRGRVVWLREQRLAAGAKCDLPDLSDAALIASSAKWLPPYLVGVRSKTDMQRLDWASILNELAGGWGAAQAVEAATPSHLTMPTGTRVRVDYSRSQPTASVRIQEAFGLTESPRLAGGAVAVVLELLSPAGRPLQVTSDLAGFWASSYSLVRKDMRGRYPKHYWPEDPSVAEATNLTKKGMERAAEQAQAQGNGGGSGGGGGAQAGGGGGKMKKGKR
ncbi:hypothetical protein FOA52_012972 [Chlamydomonas sp. UWO 241]|nr:hypothetical protein FOA52_012972 [Chlamydomonas sp. UWO 241]